MSIVNCELFILVFFSITVLFKCFFVFRANFYTYIYIFVKVYFFIFKKKKMKRKKKKYVNSKRWIKGEKKKR